MSRCGSARSDVRVLHGRNVHFSAGNRPVAVVATAPLAAEARRPLGANTNGSIATSATKDTTLSLGQDGSQAVNQLSSSIWLLNKTSTRKFALKLTVSIP